jgi:hypothetical protein
MRVRMTSRSWPLRATSRFDDRADVSPELFTDDHEQYARPKSNR